MLANLLAIVVGFGSFTFYMAAFFLPEVHRKSDFLWSGIGLFYALVLWFCAGQITGAVLLGQSAAASLVLWLGWQTLLLRRGTTPSAQQTPVRIARGGGGRPRLESSPRGRIDLEYEFVEDASNHRATQWEDTLGESPEVPPEAVPEAVPVEIVPAAVPPPELAAVDAGLAEELDDGIDLKDAIPSGSDSAISDSAISDSAILDKSQSEQATNPLKKALILAGWLKEVITDFRKPKPAKPMIELPPRPRSIPKVDKKVDQTVDQTVSGKTETNTPKTPPLSDISPKVILAEDIFNTFQGDRPADTLPEQPDPSASEDFLESSEKATLASPAEVSIEVTPSAPIGVQDEEANWPDEMENWPDDL